MLHVTARTANRPARAGSSEEGSAFIVTLMVMLVVTLAALSLSAITQTEMVVSSQERTMQRVFYSADGGLSVAAARAIRYQHYRATTYKVGERRQQLAGDGSFDSGNVLTIVDSVEVSPLIPVLVTACDGCEINEGLQWVRANHYVSSDAVRRGTPQGMTEADAVPLARRSVVSQVEAQPIKPPNYQIGYTDRTKGSFKFPGSN